MILLVNFVGSSPSGNEDEPSRAVGVVLKNIKFGTNFDINEIPDQGSGITLKFNISQESVN